MQELFIDFVGSAADLSWVPQRRPGPPLRMLRMRCSADVFLGQKELAIAGRAAVGLHLEAPWLSLRVGMEDGAASAAERLQVRTAAATAAAAPAVWQGRGGVCQQQGAWLGLAATCTAAPGGWPSARRSRAVDCIFTRNVPAA